MSDAPTPPQSEPRPVTFEPVIAGDSGARASGAGAGTFEPAAKAAPVITVGVGPLLWITAGVLFAALRIPPTWQAPVGGAELLHLAGAWQASIGLEDSRYIPTFFQFLSSLMLRGSDSEVPARLLACMATLTIPFALYALRRVVGQPAALLALTVLAFDAVTISIGSNASAMGFDLAIAAWLFVAATRPGKLPAGVAGLLAFLCATSGPIVLPAVAALALVKILRRERPEQATLIEIGVGVVFALVVSFVAYGSGPLTLRIVPFDLFADSFGQTWSTMTAGQVLLVYATPIVLGAAAAAGQIGWRLWSGGTLEPWETLLIAWFLVACAWALIAVATNSPAAAAAVTLPATLLAGVGLAKAITALLGAHWPMARIFIPAALTAAAIALGFVIDWARMNRVGTGGEQALVVLLLFAAVLALLVVALDARSRPALLAVAIGVGALPVISGAFGIGLSGIDEPVPSPRMTVQARQIRDMALDASAGQAGPISLHPRLEQATTWPFRDSGALEIATSPSANAAIVIWPADLPAPDGYSLVEGTWAFEESVTPPTRNFLRYLRWLTDRNTLAVTPEAVSIYLKAGGANE